MLINVFLLLLGIIIMVIFKYIFFVFTNNKMRNVASIFNIKKISNGMVYLHNEERMYLLSLKGIDYSMKSTDEENVLYQTRNILMKNLSKDNYMVKIYCLKGENNIIHNNKPINEVVDRMTKKWNDIVKTDNYIKYVISISFSRKSTSNKCNLDSAINIVKSSLSEYGVKPLPIEDIYNFFSNLLNLNLTCDNNKIKNIYGTNLYFNRSQGTIGVSSNEDKHNKIAKIVTVRFWDKSIKDDFIDKLMESSNQLIIVQTLKFGDPLKSLAKLNIQLNQSSLGFIDKYFRLEYHKAIEKISTNEDVIIKYNINIFIIENTENELINSVENVCKRIREYNIEPKIHTYAIQDTWKSLFSFENVDLYEHRVMGKHISFMNRFSKSPSGFFENDWGNGCINVFKSTSNSNYGLQLHSSSDKHSIAHSLMVAPSGTGKTTFFQHLILGSLKFDIDIFAFDRLQGMNVFTNAIKGSYIDLKSSDNINPFMCDNTIENKLFIKNLIMVMTGIGKKTESDLSSCVDIIFNIPKKHRVLNEMVNIIFEKDSILKKNISSWVKNGVYENWFNGRYQDEKKGDQAFSFNDNRLFTFDMTEIQKHETLNNSLMLYIMHKIRESSNKSGRGHLIFIDETRAMIRNHVFKEFVLELLLEHRKLRGSINVCFQDAGSIKKSGISNILLEQCQTKFLFPNVSAKREDYDIFNISNTEWKYIKREPPFHNDMNHTVLVKKNNENIILDIDLSEMGEMIKLYSSSVKDVIKMNSLVKEKGENEWVKHYLQ